LISAKKYSEAKVAIDIALSLDPESYEVNKEAARLALREHRLTDAVRHYELNASQMETDFSAVGMLMTCYQALGDAAGVRSAAERALERTQKLLASDPNNGSALAMGVGALAALGQKERAKEWTARALIVDPDNLNMRYNIACAFILDLKDCEAAIDILEPAIASFGKDRVEHAKSDPDLDAVREHPRFKAMMAAAEARVAKA
jgi:adenylate cyclase